jgi:hypothetical protein
MADRVEELESALRECSERLCRLEQRVGALERPDAASMLDGTGALEPEDLPEIAVPAGAIALVGRTLLVLAGAYLARALTESGLVPPALGVALGLAYAGAWQILAAREARAGRVASATFHAVASGLIAFPLIWETAAHFGLLAPRTTCAALVAFFALGLGVAWRHRLPVAATAVTSLALLTGLALFVSTRDVRPVFLAVLAVAAAIEGLAYRERWTALRWPAAAVVDLVGVMLVILSSRAEGWPESYVPIPAPAAALALLALPLLYLASLAARTLLRSRPVTAFEATQGVLSVLLGFGGAASALATHGYPVVGLGALALTMGALCYAAAFSFAERRAGQDRNFYFYSTAGALLVLGGVNVLLGPLRVLALAGLGVAAALLGRRFGRMTLRTHGALYLAAAVAEAGLVAAGARALVRAATGPVEAIAWLVAVLAAVGWAVLASDPAAPRTGLARLPQLLLAVLVAFALATAVRAGLRGLGLPPENDAGAAAVVCTGILAGLALGYALAARRLGWPELSWVAYAAVALGGVKLVAQDLPAGRPATLVASLALYGAALLLAPRLLRVGERRADPST